MLPPASIVSPDRGQATRGRFEVAICPVCAAGVTLPLVDASELESFYPSGYGPHTQLDGPIVALISSAIRRWQGFRSRRRPPLQALRGVAPGRGLDIGAGRGDVSAMLAADGWRMTAVEPSPTAVATMLERGIDAREGVLGTVVLERAGYDIALFQHSLEHTIDPVADLRRAHSALRPGGLLLVSVPNFGSWQRRAFRSNWYHLDLPRHRVHFAGATLKRALTVAGFTGVRLHHSSSAVGLPASLQYLAAGRCLFPDGLRLRIATAMCALALPFTMVLDRLLGDGDTLHAVARRGN